MNVMQSTWKVGLFVVLFAGLLLGAYAVLEKSFFAKPVDAYYGEFRDAGGVTTGSVVLMAGVKVGQVKEIKLLNPNLARLELEIDHGTKIPKGSTALIPASFIAIGDKTVTILAPQGATDVLMPGDTIPGSLGSPLDALGPQGGQTLEEVNKTLVAMRGLLEDKGLKNDLKDLMKTVNDTTKKFGGVASRIDGLIAANQSKFGQMLVTTSSTLQNMQAVSVELRKVATSGELQGKTTALLDNLNAAVLQGKQLVASMQTLVDDPELRGSFKDTVGNLKVMSDSGTKIAANAEVMSSNGVAISEETKTLMKKANGLADQVQELIDKFNKTVDKLSKPAGNFAQGVEFEASVSRDTRPGRTRADVNVFVPIGAKDKVMFGLYDAFESNKINLQLQRQVFDNLGLRYGAYAGKPGIGVDYDLASRLGMRADLYGLNDPKMDFRLNYKFGNGLSGWAGINNIFERSSPSIGVSVRK